MANIVIFGANSAVAQACAKLWAEKGNNLFLVGRDPQKLKAQVDDLKVRSRSRIESLAIDLVETRVHEEIYTAILNKFSKIDHVFVAHGILGDQEVADREFAEVMRILEVNLVSPMSLLSHGATILEKQGYGSLAAITSVAGDRGRKSNYVYGASKGGLSIFLGGLRHRLALKGISVTDIRMGFVETPMTQKFKKGPLWQSPENVAKKIVRSIDKSAGVAYTPQFWRLIMFVVRTIPDSIFKRLSL